MDPKALDAIERELLELIIQHLENNSLDVRQARKLAKDFLAILPVSNREDLLNKLKNLGTKYREAKQIYIEESGKDTIAKEQQALQGMSEAIKQGKIDHALSIAKELQKPNE